MEIHNIKILIVDDEVLIAESLKDYLIRLGYQHIKMAHSKSKAFEYLETWTPHVALLDIRMEGKYDGLDIGTRLRNEFKIPFMYVTAHADMETTQLILETKPDGYVTKPIRINELMVNLGMVVQRYLDVQDEIIVVKNGYDKEQFHFNELIYLKAEGNYVEVYLESKKLVIRSSLDAVVVDINHEEVLRIHRSYAVNSTKILKLTATDVLLEKLTLPVSRSYSKDIKLKF